MKKRTILKQNEISFAKELYLEHGFNLEYIAKHFDVAARTVRKYLGKGGVEMYEENPKLIEERLQLINVFKTNLTSDFSDLEERNYGYIIKLWDEVKNG